jgi:hypothetical protein
MGHARRMAGVHPQCGVGRWIHGSVPARGSGCGRSLSPRG